MYEGRFIPQRPVSHPWHYLKQRERRRRYKTSLHRFLCNKYQAMKGRTRGYGKTFYKGLSLCSKDEFFVWAAHQAVLKKLFKNYVDSGFVRKLAPSIDRIDPTEGYVVENMQFITLQENTYRSLETRWGYVRTRRD